MKILVFGDNRNDGSDSRVWGPVDLGLVRGKALFIYFSIDYEGFRLRFSRIGRIIR
jgi:signal peptidase I